MHVSLLSTLSSGSQTTAWVRDALATLGHDVDFTEHPDLAAADAAQTGHQLADSWLARRPDVVLALGWVAGLAATVAAREQPVPVAVRLPRPGRGDPAVVRVEAALARGAGLVLTPTPTDREALVRIGAPRARVHLLPEAVDVSAYAALALNPGDPVVATRDDDASVHELLVAMASGRAAVVAAHGSLPDLVVDGVTGIVVPDGGDLAATARALRSDPLRRDAMGLAAADRVAACYDTSVLTTVLGRLLEETRTGAPEAA
jgi:glycosyltransferase involved in cell wall biosynthesis